MAQFIFHFPLWLLTLPLISQWNVYSTISLYQGILHERMWRKCHVKGLEISYAAESFRAVKSYCRHSWGLKDKTSLIQLKLASLRRVGQNCVWGALPAQYVLVPAWIQIWCGSQVKMSLCTLVPRGHLSIHQCHLAVWHSSSVKKAFLGTACPVCPSLVMKSVLSKSVSFIRMKN